MRLAYWMDMRTPHAQRWAEAFTARGEDVHVLTPHPGPLPQGHQAPLPALLRTPAAVHARVAVVADHLRAPVWARAISADLYHLHSFLPTVLGFWSFRWPRPLVVSAWGSDAAWYGPGPMPRRRAAVLRFLLCRATVVTVTSERQLADVGPHLPPAVEPVVIPWGVDCDVFRPGPVSAAARAPHVVFYKGFHHKYAPEVLVEAIPRVLHACPRTRFSLVGDGPLRRRMEQRVHELGVSGQVTFRARVPREAVPGLLADAAVNVVCSRYESWGLASLEAQACGVPTVIANIPGLSGTGGEGSGAVSVPAGDSSALADAITHLLTHPEERTRLGSLGRRHVTTRFAWTRSVDAMAAVYERARCEGGVRA